MFVEGHFELASRFLTYLLEYVRRAHEADHVDDDVALVDSVYRLKDVERVSRVGRSDDDQGFSHIEQRLVTHYLLSRFESVLH